MTYEVQKLSAAKMAAEAKQLSEQMQPLLAGKGPEVQSAALADLVSLWLVGWPPEPREALLQEFVKLVRALIPASEQQLFGPEGYPAGWSKP